jgi:hypothetical protein
MPDDSKTSLPFSQRMGIVPVPAMVQVDCMDESLRNSLWNVLTSKVWNHYKKGDDDCSIAIVHDLWSDHLKRTSDTLHSSPRIVVERYKKYFFECSWHAAYDFIEYVANDRNIEGLAPSFVSTCNAILTREQSGYRFVGTRLVRLTSEEEIAAVEAALQYSDEYRPVSNHVKRGLELLADRTSPDYRNSIKESISAVEAMCQIITGDLKATLGQAVKKLEESGIKLHPAFETALQKMYGYTNDAEGIRHALLDESTLDADDARFMLVSCSAFVNYLKAKSSKGGG